MFCFMHARFERFQRVARKDGDNFCSQHGAVVLRVRQRAASIVRSMSMSSPDRSLAIAVDIGGTFTDISLIDRASGQVWRANLYKCGDQTSHPHWASWAPIGEALNFHQPGFFGGLDLAETAGD